MVARILLLSNITVNFVAYVIGHDKFRRALNRTVCCQTTANRYKANLSATTSVTLVQTLGASKETLNDEATEAGPTKI